MSPNTSVNGGAGAMRVLVADDDIANQKVAKGMLELLGCDVDVVDNGSQAVDRFTSERFRAVFLDCRMPGVDGFEAARRIRARERDSETHVPIIAVTGYSRNEERQKCLDAGMDDVLVKPFEIDTLSAMVDRWVSGA